MNEDQVNFYKEKDILGQEKNALFIKAEDARDEEGKMKTIHAGEYELPLIKTRYFSMLIDMIVIMLLGIGVGEIFYLMNNVPEYLRVIMFIVVFILYEPILVSCGCTIGQLVMNIRVRRLKDLQKKLWFINAFIRIVMKAILGWLSFLTVTFNKNRRAMHDLLSGSIVIVPKR